MSNVDITNPAPFPTTAILPSNSTNENPLFSAFSSSFVCSLYFASSPCLKLELSSVMILPSSATIEPSLRITSGLISVSSASFSTVNFDNFCSISTKYVTDFSSRPIFTAISSAIFFETSPKPTSRITWFFTDSISTPPSAEEITV